MLDKIMAAKIEEVRESSRAVPLAAVHRAVAAAPPVRGMRAALRNRPGVSLIAELKKQSPSVGLIRPDFDPVRLALVYEAAGAAAISVLTDHQFFGGRPEYLRQVRETVGLPLLRKDFIISDYQIYEARALGADAVLLIVAVLDDIRLREFQVLAGELGMDCLVEVHDGQELERAVASGATLIGINNRNLRTFKTDLATTRELVRHLPAEVTKVSESGIRSREDILALEQCDVDAVLVGETLMRAEDVGAAVRGLLGTQGD